jgi:hypothetical protein
VYNHNEDTREINEANTPEAGLHFHYNREERLARATDRVRALYDGTAQIKHGFFHSLVDSKPKATMMTVIVIMCLLILFMTYLYPSDGRLLDGNALSCSAMRYDNACFIALTKERKHKNAYTGLVSITVSPTSGRASASATHAVVFTDAPNEDFRWSFPLASLGEARELQFVAEAGNQTASFHVTVK